MKSCAPSALTEAERFAELADLLARGAQRFFVAQCKAEAQPRNSRDPLAAVAAVEAPCRARVLNPQSKTA